MHVLIVFATIEGQTGKIARFVDNEVRKAGHSTTLADLSGGAQAVIPDGTAAAILAAPVHERRHPKPFEAYLRENGAALSHLRTMIVSVSLNAAFPEGQDEAQDYLTEMEMRTGFRPDRELLAAGAIRSGRYDYLAAMVVRHVVMRGRDYDPSAEIHEFTDWLALASGIRDFIGAPPDARSAETQPPE